MSAAFDDEQRAFLASARRSFLFANRRDGSPTGWPMTPLWRDDDAVYCNTYRRSAKAALLERDPRVGMLVVHDERALALTGDAQLLTADDVAPMIDQMVRRDDFLTTAEVERVTRRLREGKRCVFRIAPRTVRWER